MAAAVNATTEQSEGWQRDMKGRNAALSQMARQIRDLKAENQRLAEALTLVTTGERGAYLPV